MDRDIAENLCAACERAFVELNEIEVVLRDVSDRDERRSLLLSLGKAIAELQELTTPLIRKFPDLEPYEDPGEPDTVLCDDAQLIVSRLTSDDIAVIDAALVSQCATTFRKVARVVGSAMQPLFSKYPGVPDGYYAQRVGVLVDSGVLESEGNIEYMRFSEVRLLQGASSAA
jgi:hypothetical protein